jgi:hypothetical protein
MNRIRPVTMIRRQLTPKTFTKDSEYSVAGKTPTRLSKILSKHFFKYLIQTGYLHNSMGECEIETVSIYEDTQKEILDRIMSRLQDFCYNERYNARDVVALVGRDEWMDLITADKMGAVRLELPVSERDNMSRARVYNLTVQLCPWMEGLLIIPKASIK